MNRIFSDTEDGTFLASPRQRNAGAGRSRFLFVAPTALASRSVITNTTATGRHSAAGITLVWTDANPESGNRFVGSSRTGRELLLARNTGGTALTVTVLAATDSLGRRFADQELTIEAGDVSAFGPFASAGWRQSDGYVWVDAPSTNIKLASLLLP
jgi:hypothetical protein